MKINFTRRRFIQSSALAASGITLLSSASTLSKMHIDDSPFEGYNPFTEEKTDLRISKFIGNHITVEGSIYDAKGELPIPNAKVEVWHLSPNSGKFRHRANFKTNSKGKYKFITDYPNKEKGKSARIYFKVSKGSTSYFTDLSLNIQGANISGKHWEENNQLGKNLFPKKETILGQTVITFNISI